MKTIGKLTCACLLVAMCTGCAHQGGGEFRDADRGSEHRVRNTLLAVGAAVVVGAILANQAQSNTKDAIQGAIQD